ncbi:MAG TPA: hypothetical protein VFT37_14000 [Telluria sp.]|nr:hypothetical protein [Telluria sp.]
MNFSPDPESKVHEEAEMTAETNGQANIPAAEGYRALRAEMREVGQRVGALEQRMASVEATLQHVATKADLYELKSNVLQALNAQTWKMMGFGITIVAAVFGLARYL